MHGSRAHHAGTAAAHMGALASQSRGREAKEWMPQSPDWPLANVCSRVSRRVLHQRPTFRLTLHATCSEELLVLTSSASIRLGCASSRPLREQLPLPAKTTKHIHRTALRACTVQYDTMRRAGFLPFDSARSRNHWLTPFPMSTQTQLRSSGAKKAIMVAWCNFARLQTILQRE